MRIAIVCLVLISCGCRSRHAQPAINEIVLASGHNSQRILRGIFRGPEGWKWTAPSFAFALDPPPASKPAFLELDFSVPEELPLPATVTAKVNGVPVARQMYEKPGRYLLACRVPAEALAKRPAEIEFTSDRTFTDPHTGRAQGLIAVSAGLKEFEQTDEYRSQQLREAQKGFDNVLAQRNLRMPPEKQRELMKLFHDLPIWESLWFQNVRIIKNPLDLWMLQQIAWEVKPDFVIETGTWYGGSALYWAHTLNGMGLENARVFTVDIQDLTKGASSHPLWKKYVEFFLGSSTDPAIVSKIAARTKNFRTIVNLDSDHSMHHVLEELRMYAPLVSPGSYMAVEDTHLDGVPTHPEQGPGPMAAVRQFLADEAGKDFEQDFSREAMVMTSYPGGWLKRKLK